MKINKVHLGCFGKFRDRELTFSDGLNIIYGENEAGKTTVHTAIKTAFYPLTAKSKENQEKTCYIPGNEKKAEWSVEFTTDEGKQYTSYFSMGKTKRGCEQKTIDKILGTELAEQCLGETFFRMPEEMFDNLAYMKDNTMAELKNTPLVNRQLSFANQLSQDEEEPDAIKKINGAITLIERKNNRLDKLEQNRLELQEKKRELKEKETEYQLLKDQMAANEELQQRKQEEIVRLTDLMQAIETYEQYEKLKSAELLQKRLAEQEEKQNRLAEQKQEFSYLAALTPQQISAGEELEREWEQCHSDTQPSAEEKQAQRKSRTYAVFAWLGAGMTLLCGLLILWQTILFASITAGLLGFVGFFYYKYRQYKRQQMEWQEKRQEEHQQKLTSIEQRLSALLAEFRCENTEQLKEKYRFYQELLHQWELTELALANARELFQASIDPELFIQLKETFSETVPEKQQGDLAKLQQEKAWAENRMQEYAVTHANLAGKMLNYKGDMELRIRLEEELSATKEEIKGLHRRLAILKKTREYMLKAKENIKTEYLPKLNFEVQNILREMGLTGMEQIYVDEMMEISVKAEGQNFLKSGPMLSMGTRDQIYFALRLAICRLAYREGESIPLFLDDPFVHLDDERYQHMMEYLNSCKEIQILYFTCHRRGLQGNHGGTAIQLS